MSQKIDAEIDAIKVILSSLDSLEEDVKRNVIEYVLKRVKFDVTNLVTPRVSMPSNPPTPFQTLATPSAQEDSGMHIKTFKNTKNPKSALEMAVLVAYYLQHIVEEAKRKDRINSSDVETWFKIADYPLPSGEMRFIIRNAKNAGYLDSAGGGEYKLNAVGYNLVKHNLPRSGEQIVAQKRPKKAAKKAAKGVKKAAKKS